MHNAPSPRPQTHLWSAIASQHSGPAPCAFRHLLVRANVTVDLGLELLSMLDSWRFSSEQALENFVWDHLLSLLNLTPLKRQYRSQGHICDILAIDKDHQLTILELKNTEDRYLIQQLTRYYSAIQNERPFQAQIDYSRPIRLIGIAPSFHAHTLIDRQYTRLSIELLQFTISRQTDVLVFDLAVLDSAEHYAIPIPSSFSPQLVTAEDSAPPPARSASLDPPKSLQVLLESLSSPQQSYVLDARRHILQFDQQMAEVGRSTTTQYGLPKGDHDLFKTKLCAEFVPVLKGIYQPRLLLRIPYPKREFGGPGRTYKRERVKGLTWAEVSHHSLWDASTPLRVSLFFDKIRSRPSHVLDVDSYSQVYTSLTQRPIPLRSLYDFIDAALYEWMLSITPSTSETDPDPG